MTEPERNVFQCLLKQTKSRFYGCFAAISTQFAEKLNAKMLFSEQKNNQKQLHISANESRTKNNCNPIYFMLALISFPQTTKNVQKRVKISLTEQ